MAYRAINPEGWLAPKGYNNGMLYDGTRTLCIAGQVAWDSQAQIVGPGDMGAQFIQALRNVVTVLEAAGGTPEMLAKLTIFVTDKDAYLAAAKEIGRGYREVLGRHFPAMSLVQVAALVEVGALVEIEAMAILP